MTAVLDLPMAKRNDVSTKIDAEVLEECRIAAAHAKMSLVEYLSERMREIAGRDIDAALQARAAATQTPKPKGKGTR